MGSMSILATSILPFALAAKLASGTLDSGHHLAGRLQDCSGCGIASLPDSPHLSVCVRHRSITAQQAAATAAARMPSGRVDSHGAYTRFPQIVEGEEPSATSKPRAHAVGEATSGEQQPQGRVSARTSPRWRREACFERQSFCAPSDGHLPSRPPGCLRVKRVSQTAQAAVKRHSFGGPAAVARLWLAVWPGVLPQLGRGSVQTDAMSAVLAQPRSNATMLQCAPMLQAVRKQP